MITARMRFNRKYDPKIMRKEKKNDAKKEFDEFIVLYMI